MKYRNDLKIEFKAELFGEPIGYADHVLMYRISPDQDLTYIKEHSFLGFKYKTKHKFDTSWHEARHYTYYSGAERHNKPQQNPVLMSYQEEFEKWKSSCKTMGEFFARLDEKNEWAIERWKRARGKFLNNLKPWR